MIGCLGWGSLIWDPRELPVGEWQPQGPEVNVEFVRQSSRDRLTLAIHGEADAVTSLWARMTVDRLDAAVVALAKREGTTVHNVGRWSTGASDPANVANLGSWAAQQGIDSVIWTALGPKFQHNDGRPRTAAPTADDAVAYLRQISNEGKAAKAEEYVRRAPVDTAYRQRIVRSLGWGTG